MICSISENLRFNFTDSYNIAVEERKIVKDGKTKGQERWDNVGYYGSLEHAATLVLKRHSHLFLQGGDGDIGLRALTFILGDATELLRTACERASRAVVKKALAYDSLAEKELEKKPAE